MSEDAPMNIGAALELPSVAAQRVLRMQTKLHCWATADRGRRFDDLFNLVADPCFLAVAWTRVRENTGARSAGIDKRTARGIEASADGVAGFLEELRELGIPTVADRVVQASLKLVLEPIFESDFSDSSYGFRPGRRAQDAIEDIRKFAREGYEWIFEADIAACFDEIDHNALLQRVRGRIGDKRILGLVKAFLKATLTATHMTPTPELPRAASSRRCWPISPCRSSMTTSMPNGRPTGAGRPAGATASAEVRRIAWCATPMTSWFWSSANADTRNNCGIT
jgi:RNA-directed DNA polymerase